MKRLFFLFFAFIFSIFLNYKDVYASSDEIEVSSGGKQIQENVIDLKKKKEAKVKNSSEDLFGDEQTFPFVAGLGKNAAH
tara:strand:- start:437 stop:676 length:240 start_codon:yes stop_codon:yes gene_type:complete